MARRLITFLGVLLGLFLITSPAAANQKDPAKPAVAKEDRIDGTVHMMDKATKTVTVRLRGKPQQQAVVYDDTTAFTFRNKPSTIEELKDGRRVIVLGKKNDKNQIVATRIDIRDTDPK